MAKDDLHNMMSMDLYLSMVSEEEHTALRGFVPPVNRALPLISWDVYADAYHDLITAATIERDSLKLQELSKKYRWASNPVQLLSLPYQALVVTDASLKILWVNPGFTDMTGYPANYAMGKTPNFLQGENTLHTSRQHIRQRLGEGKPFTAVITNYRKNKEEYQCEVKIFPLVGLNGQTSHFIALEQETA